jgi:hypothetical protein
MKNFFKQLWHWLADVSEEYGRARAAAELYRHGIDDKYHEVIKKYY